MTLPLTVDAARQRVWFAFGEHFLDTETRQELPASALAAVEAGYTVEEAEEVWCFEVAPTFGPNLWDVAGEWAAWDTEWMARRLRLRAERRSRPPSRAARAGYRLVWHLNHDCWRAIARLMEGLLAVEPSARTTVARDLAALANHYFDFVPRGLDLEVPGRREALWRLYEGVLRPAARLAVVPCAGESVAAFERRVVLALGL